MHKGLIVFTVVAAIALAAYTIIIYKQSATASQRRSDKILEDFKTVENNLKQTAIPIDSSNNFVYDSLLQKIK